MLNKKGFGYWSILSLILLVLTLSFSACATLDQNAEDEIHRIPVIVTSVQRGNLEHIIQYTGIVKPKKIVYVVSPLQGRVSKTYFEIGDSVRSGDTLFSIDSKELEANISLLEEQLKIAKVNVLLAKSAVASTMGSGYESQKLQLESSLISAEHNYAAAKKAFDAATVLYELGTMSSLNYYQTKNQYEQANNALKTADKAYNLYMNQMSLDAINTSKQQLNQAQASYDATKIQIESVKEQVKYANVTTPIDGVIASKDILEGSLISNTMVPYVVADTDSVQVSISVTEQVITKIAEGQTIEILIPAADSGIFMGKVANLSPVMDKETFSFPVLIDVQNPGNIIRPGMTAKVGIIDEKREDIILAPISSILNEDTQKYVFIVEGNSAVKTFVETGISNNNLIEVTKGLEIGHQLVIKGQHFLNDNDLVSVSMEGY